MSRPWPGTPNGKPSPILTCWHSRELSGAPRFLAGDLHRPAGSVPGPAANQHRKQMPYAR